MISLRNLFVGLIAGVGLLFGVLRYGAKQERDAQRLRNFETQEKTKEVIDEVESSPDRDAAVERLRDNDWVR